MKFAARGRWACLIRTLPRLGIRNLLRVVAYRFLLASRLHPVCRLTVDAISGVFFSPPKYIEEGHASCYWRDSTRYFDCIEVPLFGRTPEWYYRPALGTSVDKVDKSWWEIEDFDVALGDIKDIWDISRFSWVLAFAQRASLGDVVSLATLNEWLGKWVEYNPPFAGYNWKCGQEASIRVMHLAMAALVLKQIDDTQPALRKLVRAHLKRIRPTVAYAVAQDNNHGICEAVALFIGGSWLAQIEGDKAAREWTERGRLQIEERAARLIADDGGFSMYSVTYHREFLDALCMAEVWRRNRGLPRFAELFEDRLSRAAVWLSDLVHPQSGDAPNIGANDGTRLLPLTDTNYRDFRPSVQLASVLFCHARSVAGKGVWDFALRWLGIPVPDELLPKGRTRLCGDSGLAILKSCAEDVQVYVRFPSFRFRPSHADPLHVDLWIGGANILRGPGSYRYFSGGEWESYFPSVAAHNTVQFDSLDAMPRLGRFLYGDWLKLDSVPELDESANHQSFRACYTHSSGARHERKVSLGNGQLEIFDNVSGFKHSAVVRWRLMPGAWSVDEFGISLGELRLTIYFDNGSSGFYLSEGWEARCYGIMTRLPVLEITVKQPGCIKTHIQWSEVKGLS